MGQTSCRIFLVLARHNRLTKTLSTVSWLYMCFVPLFLTQRHTRPFFTLVEVKSIASDRWRFSRGRTHLTIASDFRIIAGEFNLSDIGDIDRWSRRSITPSRGFLLTIKTRRHECQIGWCVACFNVLTHNWVVFIENTCRSPSFPSQFFKLAGRQTDKFSWQKFPWVFRTSHTPFLHPSLLF